MNRAYLFVIVAVLGVVSLLYVAMDSTGDRSGRRSSQAGRDAASSKTNPRTGAASDASGSKQVQVEGTVRVEIRVRSGDGAIVEIRGPQSWSGRASADGSAFRGFLPSGTYSVCARLNRTAAARTFRVAKVPVLVELELSLAIVVSGTVSQPDGSPIAGATLTAFPESERTNADPRWEISAMSVNAHPPMYGSTLSDREGKYALLLPFAGEYTIQARTAGYGGADGPPRRFEDDAEGVDFVLQKGEPVSGRVVNADGDGVAGALVVVTTSAGRQSIHTIAYSNTDGEFYLDVPATGWANISVRAHGYAPRVFGRVSPPVEGLRISIDRGVVATAHIVVAGTNGQAAVGVQARLDFGGGSRTATSDKNGVLRFEQIPAHTGARMWRSLVLAGAGYVPMLIRLSNLRSEDGALDLGQHEMELGATVRGRVTDASTGNGIEWVNVRFWSAKSPPGMQFPIAGTVTGPDGAYVLTGVAADTTAILGSKEGYAQDLDRAELSKRRSDPKAKLLTVGQLLLVHDFQLTQAAAVRGRVLDHEGNGVPGVSIQGPRAGVLSATGNRGPSATTNDDGRFVLTGYRDGRMIRRLTATHSTLGTLVANNVKAGSEEELELTYKPTTRVVGLVVGPDGAPVVGAGIQALATKRGWNPNRPVGITDKDGRFVLRGVEGGKRKIVVDHGQFTMGQMLVTIVTGEHEFDVGEIRLEVGNTIGGVLVDEDGNPIAGRTVRMAFQQPENSKQVPAGGRAGGTERTFATCSTARDGRFFLAGLKAGNFQLTAEVSGMFAEQPVVPTGTKDARIVVRKGRLWQGRIISAGKPVKNAWISVSIAGEKGSIASAVSDAQGKVALGPLPPKSPVDIKIQHQTFKGLTMTSVAVDGFPREFVLDAGLTITGRVIDKSGKPIEGARVQAADGPGKNASKFASTAKDGRFTMSGLEAKPYEVTVGWTRQSHLLPEPVTIEPGKEPIEFRLEQGKKIEGTVTVARPDDHGNLRVVAIGADGKIQSQTFLVIAKSAKFEMVGLRSGSFTVKVFDGFGPDATLLAEIPDVETPSAGVMININD